MDLPVRFGAEGGDSLQIVWQDGERVVCRGWLDADGTHRAVLAVRPAAERPAPANLDRFAHEFALRDELDGAWAVRPLALWRDDRGLPVLVLENPGGELLEALLREPLSLGMSLRLALGLAETVAKLHQRGLVHKDIKPAHILVDPASGAVRLTGFGLASRLPRERPAPDPLGMIAGTLAYMAPEQTGRMNRSIDARSDLYSVGVTLYEMLTGALPFSATEPMGWVHCQIARQPVPPAERVPTVPPAVSAIVMKLLAKAAEERYQTAAGLAADLRRCLAERETRGSIAWFPLGSLDVPDQLRIPEKLYGRGREVGQLLTAFERVVARGTPELVLVSGYSGIGKSAVVNELHKALVPLRALFAAGKFDQSKRDVPYATLAQAVQSLVRQILGESDAAIGRWRAALVEALGPNGRLVVNLIPQLKLVIGEQPPVPELPLQDGQRRFKLVMQRLLGVFARAEHPLALFLDDLQWLDPATLDLLEDLLTRPELGHLLLIGAYRSNEVDAGHPLMRSLAAIHQAGAHVHEIALAPLARDHVGQMISDGLRCDPAHAAPLADLVHAKTAGNPFFAIQFLSALAEEDLLRFEHGTARWSWDLPRIHAKGYTDNVVDLLVGRLHHLRPRTRIALQQLACLGNGAAIRLLALVLGTDEAQVQADMWEAVRQELVLFLGGTFRFAHDRVQEAAYSLIPEPSRAAAHLRIGRLLVMHTAPEEREAAIFEIVGQLNQGAALITEPAEREQLAGLNLQAGKRAKASAAYVSALTFLASGAGLLTEDCWLRQHDLAFALELRRAQCEFLSGTLAHTDARLATLSDHATNEVERAAVAGLRIDLYMTLDQRDRAVATGLDYLRHLGIDWPTHPTDEDARREYDQVWSLIGDRAIEEFADLPTMQDAVCLVSLDVLNRLGPPSILKDPNLYLLIACRAVKLSLTGGNSDASSAAYTRFGILAGGRFGDHEAGFRFGRLGCKLAEQGGPKGFQARTYHMFAAHVIHWTRHLRTGQELLRRAFAVASKNCDLIFAAYSSGNLISNLLSTGDPLAEVQREAESGLAFAQKMQFGIVVDWIGTQLGLVRTLRGLTPKFGSFDDEQLDELRMERRFAENPTAVSTEWRYWVRKLQARFLAGDHFAAMNALLQAQCLLWTATGLFEMAEYHLYGALARAAACDAAPDQRQQHLQAMAAHHGQLQVWTGHCPENFENLAALAGAEIARIEGRVLDAEHLYEQAIRSAQANGFVHNEALGYELAARFYAARGFHEFSRVYLQKARDRYQRWGAAGKVRQLDESYPHTRTEGRAPDLTGTIGAPGEQLDLATVLKVSQAVSGEIMLDKLLDTLMRALIEHAGAESGVLIATRGTEPRIAAEATTRGDTLAVFLRDAPITAIPLPESIIHYVLRAQEPVLLDDASAESRFSADRYFSQRQARSILCLPLINQSKLIGVLYLENSLAACVFTPARIATLKLLASQAAISLENSRLYRELEEREARIRRLVDANIIGIYIWDLDGRILEANDAFLGMVGYSREELVAGNIRWTELTPPKWRLAIPEELATLKAIGVLQPFEREYIHKDGTWVTALMGAAGFEESRHQGVSFVLDLTERKRVEAEARENERRYREVQTELAHANRVSTMGQLSASIAHEVSQPIAAMVIHAQAGLRWLDRRSPDLEEARAAFRCIAGEGSRAGDVIGRIRALIRKTPSSSDRLDINGAIREVIELTRAEAAKQDVSVWTDLAGDLTLVEGDRVQLQQVMLNLLINAIQAMSDDSNDARDLLVSTRAAEPNGVLVVVQDTGPGFDPERVDRLFEAFYTTKPDGMGLGLAICRSIIEGHGGRMWASENRPQGAVFQFILPTERDAPVRPAPSG